MNGRNEMLVDNETFKQKFLSFHKELNNRKVTDEVKKQQILDSFEKDKRFGGKMNKRMKRQLPEVISAKRSLIKKSVPCPDGLTTPLYQGSEITWGPNLEKTFQ